jgi:hypothetical protein
MAHAAIDPNGKHAIGSQHHAVWKRHGTDVRHEHSTRVTWEDSLDPGGEGTHCGRGEEAKSNSA